MRKPVDEHLRTAELFRRDAPPIHVHRPLHVGHTPLHDHDFYEVAMVSAGRALHRDVHGQTPLRPGHVLLLQPGHWHAYERCRELRLCNLLFAPSLLARELAWAVADGQMAPLVAPRPTIGKVRLSGTADTALAAVVARLEAALQAPRVSALAAIGLLAEALATLVVALPRPAGAAAPLPASLRRCLQAMEDDLAYDWGLDGLARLAGCDVSWLCRCFREHLGSSPIAWRNQRRCERAAVRLLTGNEAIAAVGREVGWDDPNYFARRFRQAFGQSPSAYRRQLSLPAAPHGGAGWIQW